MSHSTEIVVTIGLDKFEIYCGSRQPANALGVSENKSRFFTDDAAMNVLWGLPHNGAGRMALFGLLCMMAEEHKTLYNGEPDWLKIQVTHGT